MTNHPNRAKFYAIASNVGGVLTHYLDTHGMWVIFKPFAFPYTKYEGEKEIAKLEEKHPDWVFWLSEVTR